MALVADTGGLHALYDSDDQYHRRVRAVLEREEPPIIIPTAIVAEIDYMLRAFLGVEAELSFLEGLAIGAFTLEPFTHADLKRCQQLIRQYRKADLGLADSAVMATAERLGIDRILTVDEKHFRMVRTAKGRPYTILPADV